MKRRYFAILLMAALLVSCFAVSALATQAQLNYVTDEAGLFTDTERGTLESRAQEISERYNFGVYIITLPDYRDYTTSSSVETCAMELYDDNTLGWGSDRAGTMLLLSMQERDFDLDFYSSRANRIFTEVGRDRMEDRFIPYFRNDNFYGAQYPAALPHPAALQKGGQQACRHTHAQDQHIQSVRAIAAGHKAAQPRLEPDAQGTQPAAEILHKNHLKREVQGNTAPSVRPPRRGPEGWGRAVLR